MFMALQGCGLLHYLAIHYLSILDTVPTHSAFCVLSKDRIWLQSTWRRRSVFQVILFAGSTRNRTGVPSTSLRNGCNGRRTLQLKRILESEVKAPTIIYCCLNLKTHARLAAVWWRSAAPAYIYALIWTWFKWNWALVGFLGGQSETIQAKDMTSPCASMWLRFQPMLKWERQIRGFLLTIRKLTTALNWQTTRGAFESFIKQQDMVNSHELFKASWRPCGHLELNANFSMLTSAC